MCVFSGDGDVIRGGVINSVVVFKRVSVLKGLCGHGAGGAADQGN